MWERERVRRKKGWGGVWSGDASIIGWWGA